MSEPDFEIDLVYLWVNGNDPKWRAKRSALTGANEPVTEVNCEGRFADNDELKYSLRSIELYAPWVRKIFIVTDEQVPQWLDLSNPRVRIVDHSEIMRPESRPCFNANVLEHSIANIPGLSEHFLFANDDVYLNRPVTPSTFFAPDGKPIFRLIRRPLRKLEIFFREKIRRKPLLNYNRTVNNSARLVERKFGVFFGDVSHHNIDAYCKSDYQRIFEMFREAIEPTLTNHFRSPDDFQRNLYAYAALASGCGHRLYVTPRTSFILEIYKRHHYERLREYNPVFFCVNDSQYASDSDRRCSTEFLAGRFPEKSSFEK